MKNILLFSQKAENLSNQLLRRALIQLGQQVTILDPYRLNLPLTAVGGFDRLLIRTTGVNYDDYDLEVAQAYEVSCVNNPRELRNWRDKLQQHQFFERNAIPCLPWLSQRERELRLPPPWGEFDKFVVKPLRGNQGLGVTLLITKESLASWCQAQWALADQRWLITPFRSVRAEFRFYFCRGEIRQGIERINAEGQFKANLAQGGLARKLETAQLPSAVAPVLEQLAQQIPLDFFAADIILSEAGVEVLEVNPAPGVVLLERLYGEASIRELVSNIL